MQTERPFGPIPVPFLCLRDLLEHQAKRIPDAPAILGLDRAPLTYGGLHRHVAAGGRMLRAMGIGRRDRVAVVLPNGPELPVAILMVASCASCAPVNPAFGVEELQAYFADLRPRAVIVPAGIDSPAHRVARSGGLTVIELSIMRDAEAGLFTLAADAADAASDEPVGAGDTALLLPTSGTTSRPKIVLQAHQNICASAYATGAALALAPTDRCLNILPLFHGHGLTATVVASLAAGASVVCTPGFDVGNFSAWLNAFRPTWFSAVPTMHQAILAHARQTRERLTDHRLRLVRSSSAALAPSVFAELEQAFESPVIEWYGMTEVTSSPIACNPLPPHRRKAGSVGVRVALDVAVMDEHGALLREGATGEIVVRGASVTSGYDRNPAATAAAFADGWLRTGDLGYFDDEGYLFLAGRIREMINRGGEKIAPQEIDEVLLGHPEVAEAVTFALPHATLGEDVASAVVLRPDAAVSAKDIRRFASGRIADFKVPRHVIIVKTIPKGPTGKVQRIGLAAKLELAAGAEGPRAVVAPRTPLERTLAGIWADVLEREQVGVHQDFFALGGDSLQAMRVLLRLQELVRVDVDASGLFEAPTVAEMAEHIERVLEAGDAARHSSAVVRVPRDDGRAPASIAQERFWKIQRAMADVPVFNILYPLRVTSALDAAVLERSINEIVRRHGVLRTTFTVRDGRCEQVIAPRLAVPLRRHDVSRLHKSRRQAALEKIFQSEALHAFDLENGPLIRASLVRIGKSEHLLVICLHQIVCDGWSLGVFVEELTAIYDAFAAGRGSPLAPLPIQYADFAHWQRNWRAHPDMVAQLDYWRAELRGSAPLPTPAVGETQRKTGVHTARRKVAIPAKLARAAKRFAHEEGVTLFMTLAAAFQALMHRHGGGDDVRVATLVANRNRAGVEGLIGPFVNTVILRSDLGGAPSSREIVRRVRATTLAAFAHQDLPFAEMVGELAQDGALDPAAVPRAMIWLQNTSLRRTTNAAHSRLAVVEADPDMLVPLVTISSFDVILTLRESSRGMTGTCVYKPDVFDARSIGRLLRDFQRVIERMVAQPERPISEIPVSHKS